MGGCSSEPGYCDQLDTTEQAFTELRDTSVIQEGTDTLTQRYETFEDEVDQLISSAGDEFAEESAAVEDSLVQIDAAIQSAANLDLGTAAEEIGPAIEALGTSVQALFDSVTTACA